ncbi:hypothetical protein BN1723_010955 [Verticillium longisporum]|uniref:Extracellular membrane protein CFEM domain-containing protein n=1 Tax=Verticillium longisporum TaxID=100787 RepID=A0A0G4L313_VERLO|nr:hypothetical protein BN1723_010955 [Verticillium longisporum]
MRFNNILLAGAFAVAYAQETTVTTVPGVATPTGVDAAASSAAAAINKCLKECDATDSTCQARCVSVPAPSDAQAIALDKCVGDCDQGDGSEAETNAFAQCRDQCIKEHYFDADSTEDGPVRVRVDAAAGAAPREGREEEGRALRRLVGRRRAEVGPVLEGGFLGCEGEDVDVGGLHELLLDAGGGDVDEVTGLVVSFGLLAGWLACMLG